MQSHFLCCAPKRGSGVFTQKNRQAAQSEDCFLRTSHLCHHKERKSLEEKKLKTRSCSRSAVSDIILRQMVPKVSPSVSRTPTNTVNTFLQKVNISRRIKVFQDAESAFKHNIWKLMNLCSFLFFLRQFGIAASAAALGPTCGHDESWCGVFG